MLGHLVLCRVTVSSNLEQDGLSARPCTRCWHTPPKASRGMVSGRMHPRWHPARKSRLLSSFPFQVSSPRGSVQEQFQLQLYSNETKIVNFSPRTILRGLTS